jgi:hypothetical protein
MLTDTELIMAALYKVMADRPNQRVAQGEIAKELQKRAVRGILYGTKALPKTKTEG